MNLEKLHFSLILRAIADSPVPVGNMHSSSLINVGCPLAFTLRHSKSDMHYSDLPGTRGKTFEASSRANYNVSNGGPVIGYEVYVSLAPKMISDM